MPDPESKNAPPTLKELDPAVQSANAVEQARRAAQIGTVKGAAKALQKTKSFVRGFLPVSMAADLAQTTYTGFDKSADEQLERAKNPYTGAVEGAFNPATTFYNFGRGVAGLADQIATPFVDDFTKTQQIRRGEARKYANALRANQEKRYAPQPEQYSVRPIEYGPPSKSNSVKQAAPSLEREPYASEMEFFYKNPGTAGMATEDDRVIVNPYSNLSEIERNALILNETSRVFMHNMPSNERPSFLITPEQGNAFKNYGSEQNIRETIAARILSGDPSAGAATQEQMAFASSLAEKMKTAKPEQYGVRPPESGSTKIDPYKSTRKLELRP